MHDALREGVLERAAALEADLQHVLDRQQAALLDELREVSSDESVTGAVGIDRIGNRDGRDAMKFSAARDPRPVFAKLHGRCAAETGEAAGVGRIVFGRLSREVGEQFAEGAGVHNGAGEAVLAKGAFNALKSRMNPDRYGGAPLLGVRGNILKAHGSSNRHALASAIRAAAKIIRQDLYENTARDVARANSLLTPPPPESPVQP